jgi:hypothetical protein
LSPRTTVSYRRWCSGQGRWGWTSSPGGEPRASFRRVHLRAGAGRDNAETVRKVGRSYNENYDTILRLAP